MSWFIHINSKHTKELYSLMLNRSEKAEFRKLNRFLLYRYFSTIRTICFVNHSFSKLSEYLSCLLYILSVALVNR